MMREPPRYTLFPYATLFRSGTDSRDVVAHRVRMPGRRAGSCGCAENDASGSRMGRPARNRTNGGGLDRKSTRLNSSHANISYAVFCLKKKHFNKYLVHLTHT